MKINRKYKRYLRTLILNMLKQPDKWELESGAQYSSYWYYYICFVERNDIKVRIDINPSFILFNSIEVRIKDDVVYKFRIIPLSNIFRLILTIRLYIWKNNKANIEDDNSILIEELIQSDRDDVKYIEK